MILKSWNFLHLSSVKYEGCFLTIIESIEDGFWEVPPCGNILIMRSILLPFDIIPRAHQVREVGKYCRWSRSSFWIKFLMPTRFWSCQGKKSPDHLLNYNYLFHLRMYFNCKAAKGIVIKEEFCVLLLASKVAEIRALQLNHFDVPVVMGLILYQQRQLNRFALAWFNRNSSWIQQKQWRIPDKKLDYKDQSWPVLFQCIFLQVLKIATMHI